MSRQPAVIPFVSMTRAAVSTHLDTYKEEGLLLGYEVDQSDPFTIYYDVSFVGFSRRWTAREVVAFIEGVIASRTPQPRSLF